MAFCSNCGQKLELGAKFCSECGAPVGGSSNTQRQQVFEGDIHKCPNCGEIIKAFEPVCPSCGYEFRNTASSSAVKEFSRKLEQIEASRRPVSVIDSVVKSLGFGIQQDTTDEQVLNYIRTFNVPNTKEDAFEFMILASSNINYTVLSAEKSSDAGANSVEEFNKMKARSEAWVAKVEQVYQKARISFGSDNDFQKIQDLYERVTQALYKAKKEKKRKATTSLIPILLLILLFVLFFGSKAISHNNLEKKLQATVKEIQANISNGDYDTALIKAQSLHMDDDWSSKSKEHWDEQRAELIKLIEQKKEGK